MTDTLIEKTLWHPVALSHVVGSQPQAANLLGQPLVLWRDADNTAHAWADQCPHRGARLTLGRVHGGQLECPYHGWRFEAGGACTHVPAVPDFQPGARHAATTFDAREAYGMLWVRLAAPTGEPQPIHHLPLFAAEAETPERLAHIQALHFCRIGVVGRVQWAQRTATGNGAIHLGQQ